MRGRLRLTMPALRATVPTAPLVRPRSLLMRVARSSRSAKRLSILSNASDKFLSSRACLVRAIRWWVCSCRARVARADGAREPHVVATSSSTSSHASCRANSLTMSQRLASPATREEHTFR